MVQLDVGMADHQVSNMVGSVQEDWMLFPCVVDPQSEVYPQDGGDCAGKTAETVKSWRMSAAGGHGEKRHITRENSPAALVVVDDDGCRSVQRTSVRRASYLLL